MSEDLQTQFEQAADAVTRLSQAPDNLAKLRLYALYKQVTKGDNHEPKPGMKRQNWSQAIRAAAAQCAASLSS